MSSLDDVMRLSMEAFSPARLRGVIAEATGMDDILVVNSGAIQDACGRQGPHPEAIVRDMVTTQGLPCRKFRSVFPAVLKSWLSCTGSVRSAARLADDGVVFVNDNGLWGNPAYLCRLLGLPGREAVAAMADWIALHEAGHVREHRSGTGIRYRDTALVAGGRDDRRRLRPATWRHAEECYANAHATLGLVAGGMAVDTAVRVTTAWLFKTTILPDLYHDGSGDMYKGIYNGTGVLDRILARAGNRDVTPSDVHAGSLDAARRGAFPIDVLLPLSEDTPVLPDWFPSLRSYPVLSEALSCWDGVMHECEEADGTWVECHPYVLAAADPVDAFRRAYLACNQTPDEGRHVPATRERDDMLKGMGGRAREWLQERCGLS